ncbi:MAG: Gfo/Idh/MocA family oxidoreductase [Ruminococcaceae bacterium]|nr:Gfo/Idh/MocA family oxidoreductase [Oscillospiraceae bacterium]
MYKYAIIGFGGLGKLHLGNLLKLEKERGDIKLTAICGADPNAFTSNVKLNIGDVDISTVDFSSCGFYTDYKELIEKEKPDFIISTLPTYLHEEIAVYALNHGIHVFSEKPMALTESSCENMINAANKNSRKLMIGQCLRFDPISREIKKYIDEETFGKAFRAEFSRYSQTPVWTWNNWILDPEQSGGCILDMHVHDVDLINYYFGVPEAVDSVITEKKTKLESVFTRYFYKDLLVTASADWAFPQTFPFEQRCIIHFKKATVCVTNGKLTVYTDGEAITPKLSTDDYYIEEMRAFLSLAIDNKPCPITSPESIFTSVKIALKEEESATTGKKIQL